MIISLSFEVSEASKLVIFRSSKFPAAKLKPGTFERLNSIVKSKNLSSK